MSAFTRARPFLFQGVISVWHENRDTLVVCSGGPQRTVFLEHAEAIAAMLEAESHPAEWTDMGDRVFRKGRLTVRLGYRRDGIESSTTMTHEECGYLLGADPDTDEINHAATVRAPELFADFLAWHAAQPKIQEPQGLGARVLSDQGIRFVRTKKGIWINLTTHVEYTWAQLRCTVVKVEDDGVK